MAQSLSRIWTHLIFSTKDRFPFLNDKILRRDMHAYLAEMLRTHDCETLIVGGVEDHTHSLFALSRTHSIASVVKEVKRTSSGWIKQASGKLSKFHWQGGYAAFSVSQSMKPVLVGYIQNQEEHHRKWSFQDEVRWLCQLHEVAIDERYIWE